MSDVDKHLLYGVLIRTDTKYMKGNQQLIEDAFVSISKSMLFLGFYEEKNVLKTRDDKG